MSRRISRRAFLKGAAVGGGGLVILSSRSLRAYAANTKPNIAVIGCGGRGKEFTHGYVYAGGRQYTLVSMCDVNEKKATRAYQTHPDVPKFHDYRKMLDEKHKEMDGVFVVTPDHSHAAASLCAMVHGKHTYCEKPLTRTVYEARLMRDTARKYKLATQMGNQGSSSGQFRRAVELIQEGALGEIKEYYGFCTSGGPNKKAFPSGKEEVPSYLKWDLWLGPAAYRDFHPLWTNWHVWRDFSNHTLGGWGAHTNFLAFMALKVGAVWSAPPGSSSRIRVRAEVSEINRISFPKWQAIHWQIPARENLPPITLTWVDGGIRGGPARKWWDRIEDHIGKKFSGWSLGALIVGTKGKIQCNGHNNVLTYLPAGQYAGVETKNPKKLPRSRGHQGDWLAACGGAAPALSNFENTGPYWEMLALGSVAAQFDEELEYDTLECRVVNNREADALVHAPFREGWSFGKPEPAAAKKPQPEKPAGVSAKSPSRSGSAADAAREERAQGLLNVARGALRRGQRAAARAFLKKVVADYPGTEAAKEAALLLKG